MGEQPEWAKERKKKKFPIEFHCEMFLYRKQKKNPNDFWRLERWEVMLT